MGYEIYTKPGCRYCVDAKAYFRLHHLAYTEFVVGEDLTRDELLEQFPDAKSLPIILLDGQIIGGYDDLVAHHDPLVEKQYATANS